MLAPEIAAAVSLTGNDCAIFSYDLDANGLIDNSERMGFRYNATNMAVEMRKGGTDSNCSGDDWENVTDEKTIDITFFNIEDQSPGVLSAGNFDVNIRQYSIEMRGRLKSDNSIERFLRETIRVRNDRVS
ncbi:MAG: hypothetical protein R6W97_06045 [Thiobacillus sp.]